MKKENGKQDVQIAKLEVKVDNLEIKLNEFITNEFQHFKSNVDAKFNWIMGLVVLGIMIPILLFVIK